MKVEGTIEHIIFRNAENGFSIFIIEKDGVEYTLVGTVYALNVGEYIKAECDEVNDARYGHQYKIKNYDVFLPKDDESIVKFLASDMFNGIGVALATRLVDMYGDEVFDNIENNKEEVMKIKGMTEKRYNTINDVLILKKSEIDIILNLERYDLSLNLIKKIIDKYGIQTNDIINNNPYRLARDIDGVGFIISDKIALKNGIKEDSDERIKSAIVYLLEEAEYDGNVFLYKDELSEKINEILGFNVDIDKFLLNLCIENDIKIINGNGIDKVYLIDNYDIEYNLTNLLYTHKDNIKIITGGPGTGKTYNIKKYISECNEKGLNIILCAPTGRAAKRMSEVTKCDAKTIHRTLDFQRITTKDGKDITIFNKNENNKLNCDFLIVDEVSMVDMKLLYHLMKAVSDETNVLFVGDVDQLPSIGAGEVLKDMINSGWFDVTTLTTIYRQEEDSHIVLYSHEINKGNDIDLTIDCEDFKFVRRLSDTNIKNAITELVCNILPRHFNVDKSEIQVICPSKKKECGSDGLNNVLQNILNAKSSDKEEIVIGQKIFREGDKVMQVKNNYDLHWVTYDKDNLISDEGDGVFNGDIGIIKKIDKFENLVTILFDDREVVYRREELEDLSLGYAITVHKAQGSEYDVVVVPITYFPRPLLNRKILYTAMTRAKKCIIFIGYEDVFNTMIRNEYDTKRNSSLCDKFYIS